MNITTTTKITNPFPYETFHHMFEFSRMFLLLEENNEMKIKHLFRNIINEFVAYPNCKNFLELLQNHFLKIKQSVYFFFSDNKMMINIEMNLCHEILKQLKVDRSRSLTEFFSTQKSSFFMLSKNHGTRLYSYISRLMCDPKGFLPFKQKLTEDHLSVPENSVSIVFDIPSRPEFKRNIYESHIQSCLYLIKKTPQIVNGVITKAKKQVEQLKNIGDQPGQVSNEFKEMLSSLSNNLDIKQRIELIKMMVFETKLSWTEEIKQLYASLQTSAKDIDQFMKFCNLSNNIIKAMEGYLKKLPPKKSPISGIDEIPENQPNSLPSPSPSPNQTKQPTGFPHSNHINTSPVKTYSDFGSKEDKIESNNLIRCSQPSLINHKRKTSGFDVVYNEEGISSLSAVFDYDATEEEESCLDSDEQPNEPTLKTPVIKKIRLENKSPLSINQNNEEFNKSFHETRHDQNNILVQSPPITNLLPKETLQRPVLIETVILPSLQLPSSPSLQPPSSPNLQPPSSPNPQSPSYSSSSSPSSPPPNPLPQTSSRMSLISDILIEKSGKKYVPCEEFYKHECKEGGCKKVFTYTETENEENVEKEITVTFYHKPEDTKLVENCLSPLIKKSITKVPRAIVLQEYLEEITKDDCFDKRACPFLLNSTLFLPMHIERSEESNLRPSILVSSDIDKVFGKKLGRLLKPWFWGIQRHNLEEVNQSCVCSANKKHRLGNSIWMFSSSTKTQVSLDGLQK